MRRKEKYQGGKKRGKEKYVIRRGIFRSNVRKVKKGGVEVAEDPTRRIHVGAEGDTRKEGKEGVLRLGKDVCFRRLMRVDRP